MTTFVSPNPNTPQKTLARQSVVTVGLIAMLLAGITLISYFFYTAATLRSNTMLTLSWAIVSLWLLAVVWSDEVLALPKKIALTFTLPFAYFILYIQLFISVVSLTRKLISAISWPKIHVRNIHAALLQEAYSTRF